MQATTRGGRSSAGMPCLPGSRPPSPESKALGTMDEDAIQELRSSLLAGLTDMRNSSRQRTPSAS